MWFGRWLYLYRYLATVASSSLWGCSAVAAAACTEDESRSVRLFPGLAADVGVCAGLSTQQDEQCFRDSLLLRENARNYTLWASLMMDASSGSPTGALHGSRFSLGNYDGCLAAGQMSPVGSRYCLARYSSISRTTSLSHHSEPAAWTDWQDLHAHTDTRNVLQGVGRFREEIGMRDVWVALCVPRSCGPLQVQRALVHESELSDKRRGGIHVGPESCTTGEHQGFLGLLIYGLGVVALATLAAISTLLDFTEAAPTSTRTIWIMSWSLSRRLKGLLAPEQPVKGLALQPLAGIRAITLILLVVAHHCMHLPRTPSVNNFVTRKVFMEPMSALATQGFLYVYTMFFLSGLLISVGSKESFLRSITLRYLRLTPSYLAVVAFYAVALPATGDGPRWKELVTPESEGCANSWWTNILYVNNYVRPAGSTQGCVLQSWSLAVDMQLCIIATFLLILEKSLKKTVRVLWAVAFVFSLVAPFITTVLGLREPVWRFLPTVLEDVWAWHFWTRYVSTEQWALPYLVGILTGSLLQRCLKSGYALSLTRMRTLLMGSAVSLALLLLSGTLWSHPHMPQQSIVAGVYASCMAAAWSACLAIVSTALVLSPKSRLKAFLSWQPFVVVSRLSYTIYLVHFGAQITQVARMRTLRYVATLNVIGSALLETVCIIPICLALYLLIEAPIRDVSKGFFHSKSVSRHDGLPLQLPPLAGVNEVIADSHVDNRRGSGTAPCSYVNGEADLADKETVRLSDHNGTTTAFRPFVQCPSAQR